VIYVPLAVLVIWALSRVPRTEYAVAVDAVAVTARLAILLALLGVLS
jgi:hypothetical protein